MLAGRVWYQQYKLRNGVIRGNFKKRKQYRKYFGNKRKSKIKSVIRS